MTDNKTLSSNQHESTIRKANNNKNVGPKHGFLSLLFCCMSDTSALIDPHVVKTSNNNNSDTAMGHETTTTTNSSIRVKRKKKHWYRRWYSSKSSSKPSTDIEIPQSRQVNNNNNNQQVDVQQLQQQNNIITSNENNNNNNNNKSNILINPTPRFSCQWIYDTSTKIHYLFGGDPHEYSKPDHRLNDLWTLKLIK